MRFLALALALSAIIALTPPAQAATQSLTYAGSAAPLDPCLVSALPQGAVCFSVPRIGQARITVHDSSGAALLFTVSFYSASHQNVFDNVVTVCNVPTGVAWSEIAYVVVRVSDGTRICPGGGPPTVGTVTADIS